MCTGRQLELAPRYLPSDRGSAEHNRIIRTSDSSGRVQREQRHVDQIWRLHAAGDPLYAGVSEAWLFRSFDRGDSWEPVRGLNDRPSRNTWILGFGGLCVHALAHNPADPDVIYRQDHRGMYLTRDGGDSWQPIENGLPVGRLSDGCPRSSPG